MEKKLFSYKIKFKSTQLKKLKQFQKILLFSLLFITGIMLTPQVFSETLHTALVQTLQTNPDILVTVKDRYAVQEELNQAKDGYLPTLDANAQAGIQRVNNSLNSLYTNSANNTVTLHPLQAGLVADQPLFDGFATSQEVNRTQAKVCSASYKILGTAQDILLQATKAYLDVLKEQQLVKEAQANVGLHRNIYTLIKKRNESGIDLTADLTQSQGRSDLATANLRAEESNLTDSQSNYFQIIGHMPSQLVLPVSSAADYMPATEQQAIQIALANHPILKSAQQDMKAAYAQYKASQSKNYPRFDLQLSANRGRDISEVEGRNNDEKAAVLMNYNLFHGGADKAKQNQNAYLYQSSAEVMHKTYRQVINNVQLSWSNWQYAKMRLSLLQSHRDVSLKTFKAYKQQFELDKRTLLDSLDAQNEYYEAARAYTQGQFDVLYGQYRVLNSIGKLLQAEHINFNNPI